MRTHLMWCCGVLAACGASPDGAWTLDEVVVAGAAMDPAEAFDADEASMTIALARLGGAGAAAFTGSAAMAAGEGEYAYTYGGMWTDEKDGPHVNGEIETATLDGESIEDSIETDLKWACTLEEDALRCDDGDRILGFVR